MSELRSPEASPNAPVNAHPPDGPPPTPSRVWSWLARGRVSDAWCFAVGYAILLPFFLAPLFATRLLPGLDLPFHIAAADLLSKVGRPDSPYASYYDGGLGIAPYTAHFLALLVLGKVMSLLAAHKLIIVLYVAGLPLAAASLLAACRRNRVPALLAFPLAYNLTLHYGFVSFALSLPAVLLLLSAMVRLALAHGRGRVLAWWLVTAAVAFLLYLFHLQNFLYGVCAASAFAVLVPQSWRRKLLALVASLPALVALVHWHLSSPPVAGQARLTLAGTWRILKAHRLADLSGRTPLVDLWNRILLIPSHAMRAFVDEINVPACQILCLIMGVYALAGIAAAFSRRHTASTFRRVPLAVASAIAFLGALGAYLALPHHLQEMELMTFFPRFSVLVLLMFLVIVPGGLLRLRGVLAVLLPVPAVVFGIVYGSQLYRHYRAYGAEIDGFVEVAQKTPAGGKALGLVFDRRSKVMQIDSALVGVPNFYPALRPARGSMVPPAYCGLRHMPCRCKISRDFATNPWAPQKFAPGKMLEIFDYFFVRSLPPGFDLFRGYHGMVDLVASSGTWAAYRKRPGPIVADPPPPQPRPAPPPPPPAVVPAAVPVAPAPPTTRPKPNASAQRKPSSGLLMRKPLNLPPPP